MRQQKGREWEPPFEWESYPLADGSGFYQRRLVLKPNRRTDSTSPAEYAGSDYWNEDVWRQIEELLISPQADPELRERVRQPVFNYLYGIVPAGRMRLVVDRARGRVEEEWSCPETDRPLRLRWPQVRKHVGALERSARAVQDLVSLLVPDGRSTIDRRERERALSLMLYAIGPGPAHNLPAGSLIPVANDVRFANDFLNRVIPPLEAIVPALQTFADAAPQVLAEIPTSRPGPKGDGGGFRLLVRQFAELYAERRGRWPAVSPDRVKDYDDVGYYVGDLAHFFELIVPWLPKIPGTFSAVRTSGARGKRIQRCVPPGEADEKRGG